MKTIKGRITGLRGHQFRLQDEYVNFAEFKNCAEIYWNHWKLGFSTPEACWKADPVVQCTVDPRDYCRVLPDGTRRGFTVEQISRRMAKAKAT